jgi:hypothetical protein
MWRRRGGGGGTAQNTTPTPQKPQPQSTSAASQTGAIGVLVSANATDVATSAGTGTTGTAVLTTLPSSGGPAQYSPISIPAITSSVSGVSLDGINNIGAAFSYDTTNVAFFNLSTGAQIGDINLSSSLATPFSGSNVNGVGGLVLDPTTKTAIASTGSGFQIINYSVPAAPTATVIPSYDSNNTNGIDIAENFGYDSSLSIAGKNYHMILSGAYNSLYAAAITSINGAYDNQDGSPLELADTQTGFVYKPDASTLALFNQSIDASGMCNTDQIGIDTAYQVAVLGCETQPFVVLVNLNNMTLSPPANQGSDGTYHLPASAVLYVQNPGGISSTFDADNVAVESNTHTVFMGSGGFEGPNPLDTLIIAKLNDPTTGLGFATATAITMPTTAPVNTATCGSTASIANANFPTCSNLTPSTPWSGYGDPHANAAYLAANGDAIALWSNSNLSAMAVIDMTKVLANPTNYGNAIMYQPIP